MELERCVKLVKNDAKVAVRVTGSSLTGAEDGARGDVPDWPLPFAPSLTFSLSYRCVVPGRCLSPCCRLEAETAAADGPAWKDGVVAAEIIGSPGLYSVSKYRLVVEG